MKRTSPAASVAVERYELRVLPQPVHRYADAKSGLIDGAMFIIAYGRNPEIVMLIEAHGEGSSEPAWHCGFARVAAWSTHVEFDGKEIWSGGGHPKGSDDTYWLFTRPVQEASATTPPNPGVLKTWPCRVCLFTPFLLRLNRLRRTPHPNPPPQGGRGLLGLRRWGESNRVSQQKRVRPPRAFCPFKTDFSSPHPNPPFTRGEGGVDHSRLAALTDTNWGS